MPSGKVRNRQITSQSNAIGVRDIVRRVAQASTVARRQQLHALGIAWVVALMSGIALVPFAVVGGTFLYLLPVLVVLASYFIVLTVYKIDDAMKEQ